MIFTISNHMQVLEDAIWILNNNFHSEEKQDFSDN